MYVYIMVVVGDDYFRRKGGKKTDNKENMDGTMDGRSSQKRERSIKTGQKNLQRRPSRQENNTETALGLPSHPALMA